MGNWGTENSMFSALILRICQKGYNFAGSSCNSVLAGRLEHYKHIQVLCIPFWMKGFVQCGVEFPSCAKLLNEDNPRVLVSFNGPFGSEEIISPCMNPFQKL